MSHMTREQEATLQRAFNSPHRRTILRGSERLFGSVDEYAHWHEISRNKALLLILATGLDKIIDTPDPHTENMNCRAAMAYSWRDDETEVRGPPEKEPTMEELGKRFRR